MNFIKELYNRNKILANLGTAHLIIAVLLAIYFPFNHSIVTGLNSVTKPIKFALSIAIYSYSMTWFLYYLDDKRKVIRYSWVAVIAMGFEQLAITFQALRGQQSHFNHTTLFNGIVFGLMGVFILTITLWTAYMAYLFIKQKAFIISKPCVLSVRIGIIYFVMFSMFGGYVAKQSGHTVGAEDGGNGLPFIDWSTMFGDLRVAHFFGLHSLQLIPFIALLCSKYFKENTSIKIIWGFSILYVAFILFVMISALNGQPFINTSAC